MKNYLFVPVLLGGLSACSMPALESLKLPSFMGENKPATMASATGSGVREDPMRQDIIAFANAYCRKDGLAAVAATQNLVVAHPKYPRAQLNYGLALDLAGRGVAAYTVLDRLAKGSHPMPAVLLCGDDFKYSGTVTEVAQRRLFNIKTALSALGMTLPPPSPGDMKAARETIYRLASMAPAADEVLPVDATSERQKPRVGQAKKRTTQKNNPWHIKAAILFTLDHTNRREPWIADGEACANVSVKFSAPRQKPFRK